VLLFTTVLLTMRGLVIDQHPVEVTLGGSNLLMLFRILIAAVFVALAVHGSTERLNFGKLFSLIAIVIVVGTALLPLVGVFDINWNLPNIIAGAVFEFILWCLLGIIAYQKRISATVVFGLGYGLYMLGSTLGCILGVSVMPLIATAPFVQVFYLVLAGIILALSFILFSERDFARLFSPIHESELSLESLLEIPPTGTEDDDTESDAAADDRHQPRRKGSFTRTLATLATERGLSPREADVLRYLAMGRGSDFIAEQLSVSWNTVRTHTHNVYVKLDVHSRQELITLVDELMREPEAEQ